MLLSPTSNAGQTSRVLLADIILSINKASLALFIARVMPRPIWSLEALLYCRVYLLWLKHRNSKSRVGLRLHLCDWGADINVSQTVCALYWRPFTICTIRTMYLLGMWSSFSYTYILECSEKSSGFSPRGWPLNTIQPYLQSVVRSLFSRHVTFVVGLVRAKSTSTVLFSIRGLLLINWIPIRGTSAPTTHI